MKNKTFTPILKKKYSSDKFGIINIRMTHDRSSEYFSLKETIKEQYWNKKRCEVKSNYDDFERINKLISEKIQELKYIHGQTEDIKAIKKNEKGSFISFFDDQVNFLLQRKRIGTYKSYKTSLLHLQNFIHQKGKIDLLFADIETKLIINFETYLLNKGINNNSCKKYISTIKKVFNEGVKMKVFYSVSDPFIMFENTRLPVEKKRLEKIHISKIIQKNFPENSTLYHTRNYFLFQTFGQGLRVSDLFTLRWSNLQNGNIVFVQRKTNKKNIVLLNDMIIHILREYTPDKCSKIYNQKYSFVCLGEKYSMNYDELKNHYKKISKEHISGFIKEDKSSIQIIESWKKTLDSVWEKVKFNLVIYFHKYSKENPSKFIFPFIVSDYFKDVIFDNNTTLTKEQHNHINSRNVLYNKQLKRLQKECEIDIKLTSHIPRHTYTNLMIEITGRDIYTISKTLGHTRLSTTDHYVDDFNVAKITDDLGSLSSEFNFL
jgi:site-specific recombinase XerD